MQPFTIENSNEEVLDLSGVLSGRNSKGIYLYNCRVKVIKALPESLRGLRIIACNNLTTICPLPPTLSNLIFDECNSLTVLPWLPASLKFLTIHGTKLQVIPPMDPDSLEMPPKLCIYASTQKGLAVPFPQEHTVIEAEYRQLWNEWHKDRDSRRTIGRCMTIKEELMMACWHPNNVAKWLDNGYNVEDM